MTITCLKFKQINKNLIESLVNSTIYFAKPSELNDPFDCTMDVKKVLEVKVTTSVGDQKLPFLDLLNRGDFFVNWERIFGNIGVFSSSIDIDDSIKQTLLWSHYANQHKGVCLNYEFPSEFLNKDQFSTYRGGKVEYLLDLPADRLYSNNLDPNRILFQLINIALNTKQKNWEYEKEFRIIKDTYGHVEIKKEYLKSIYFGIATSDADISLIKKLAKHYCSCDVFYKIVSDGSLYGLEAKQI